VDDERPSHRVDRLRRAWQLVKAGHVERLGGTQYRVAGQVEEFYYIDTAAEIPCTCRDVEHRSKEIHGMCKHLLACRLAGLDPGLLDTIAEWMSRETEQQAATARTKTRRTHSPER
jgi:hypothetical protein